ncbi:MAG: 2-C-methyl-D-erythritol 4-phosphate cytidylyltransferase [Candidatus Omnitrophica bacterium]|nr:2-C-methyl-D-erythritol 4-phosphate cytidylyltransferase [Candidatus Omnitrophota bacterium]
MKTQVIIVAAGTGIRLKSKIPKALVLLKRKPLVSWSLETFQKSSLIDSIVLVGHQDYLRQFEKVARRFHKVEAVVAGGAKRSDSVCSGLDAVDEDTQIVLVHDAARPLIGETSLWRLMQALKNYKAAILAVPVKPTIKKVNAQTLCVEQTMPRHLLWEAQTPQGFDRQILMQAHQQRIKEETTDDAMLVEKMGVKVKVVMGDCRNVKITTAEDLRIAQQWL